MLWGTKSRRGHTAMEAVVVVAILSTFLALVIPRYFTMRGNNAVNVAEKVTLADVKRAKDVAATSGSGRINLAALVAGATGIAVTDNSGKVVWQEVLPYGATVSTNWGNNVVTFQQNGTASTGGIITIKHPGASLSRQIRIIQFTGGIIEL